MSDFGKLAHAFAGGKEGGVFAREAVDPGYRVRQ